MKKTIIFLILMSIFVTIFYNQPTNAGKIVIGIAIIICGIMALITLLNSENK